MRVDKEGVYIYDNMVNVRKGKEKKRVLPQKNKHLQGHNDTRQKRIKRLAKISVANMNLPRTARKLGLLTQSVVYRYRVLVDENIIPNGRRMNKEAELLLQDLMDKEEKYRIVFIEAIKKTSRKRIASVIDSYAKDDEAAKNTADINSTVNKIEELIKVKTESTQSIVSMNTRLDSITNTLDKLSKRIAEIEEQMSKPKRKLHFFRR